MTDVHDILDLAAGDESAPLPVTLESDVDRGRRALVRHRAGRTATGLVAVAATVAVVSSARTLWPNPPVESVVPGATADPAPPSRTTTTTTPPAAVAEPPELVAGADYPGLTIRPALIPQGWSVAGNDFALVLSPPGVETVVDDWQGKLVVSLDGISRPSGAKEIPFGRRTGWLVVQGDVQVAVVPWENGHDVVVQLPVSVHASTGWIGTFLDGLTVTAGAQVGRG